MFLKFFIQGKEFNTIMDLYFLGKEVSKKQKNVQNYTMYDESKTYQ